MGEFRLALLPLSWRLLVTGFVLTLGAGYLTGALNAALSVGISPAAIADHYGDQSLSAEEVAAIEAEGFVEEEFSLDEPEPMAMDHDDGHMAPAGGGAPMSITAQQMAQLSHVHLLGFAMILLSAGALTCMTALPEAARATLVTALFLGLGLDIGGLWLVRYVAPGFAALNMAAGVTIGICLLITSLRVLWELWLAPRPARS